MGEEKRRERGWLPVSSFVLDALPVSLVGLSPGEVVQLILFVFSQCH